MNPKRALDIDVRVDIDGSWHRAAIKLPLSIDANGAAVGDKATCPTDVDIKAALLPNRELGRHLAKTRGAALVGTREPILDHVVFKIGATSAIKTKIHKVSMPTDRIGIETHFFTITGVGEAAASIYKLGSWQFGWVIDFNDRLRTNGLNAKAIIGERAAAHVVREFVLTLANGDRAVARAQAVTVGRALIDASSAAIRALTENHAVNVGHGGIARLVRAVEIVISGIVDAHVAHRSERRDARLNGVARTARTLINALGHVSVSGGSVKDRLRLLERRLSKNGALPPPLMSTDDTLDELNTRIAGLPFASSGAASQSQPNAENMGIIANLALPNRHERAEKLSRVRGDLIYQLIMNRRLARIYEVLPWMCASSATFPYVWGGPLGAVAQLFELARVKEIAHELKARLFDDGEVTRLDARKATIELTDGPAVRNTVVKRRRVGFLLAEGAMSHHMLAEHLANGSFDALHPVPTVLGGRQNWQFVSSTKNRKTAEAISSVESAQPVYHTNDFDADVPRYYGMTLLDMLGCAIVEIFDLPSGSGKIDRALGERADCLRRYPDAMMISSSIAQHELMRSILKSLDLPTAGSFDEWASNGKVKSNIRAVELKRLDDIVNRVGKRECIAQGRRGRAVGLAGTRGPRARHLKKLIDNARHWPGTEKTTNELIKYDDETLARVLRGCSSLRGTDPIGHCFYHVLWFKPDVDADLWSWIARGAAKGAYALRGSNMTVTAIRHKINELQRKAHPTLYDAPLIDRHIRTLLPLVTGLGQLAADPAHANGLTSLVTNPHAIANDVINDVRRIDQNVATAAHRARADDEQDENHDGGSGHRPNFAIQSPVRGRARPSVDFSARSRIEGCRTDQRRARRRSS